MDELSAWQRFFATGYVADYLKYKSMYDAENMKDDIKNKEAPDEIPNRRTDYKGTEYR